MPTAIHTHIHIQDTLLALSKPNTVPHVDTQNEAHNLQIKFWPYTPPCREYAAHAQAPYGYCTVRMRTALARTNEHAHPFIRTRPQQTTRNSEPIGQSWRPSRDNLNASAQIPLPALTAIGHEVQPTLDQCKRLAPDLVIRHDLAMPQNLPKLTADWFTQRMSAPHTPATAASK